MDRDAVATRLAELRADLTAGEQALHELESRRERLVADLLRISGAAQVLDEVLNWAAAEQVDEQPQTLSVERHQPVATRP